MLVIHILLTCTSEYVHAMDMRILINLINKYIHITYNDDIINRLYIRLRIYLMYVDNKLYYTVALKLTV